MRCIALRAFVPAASGILCLIFSHVATAERLYADPPQPLEGCPEIFSPTLCRDFDFLLQSETASRFEQDRLLVVPRSAVIIPACSVAALIRETEALPDWRFIELRFERITIQGTLHLSEIEPRARLSFFDVNFVPAPSTSDASPEIVGTSSNELMMVDAALEQPAFPTDGGGAATDPSSRSDRSEPLECLRSEPIEPAFAGSSIVIERSYFRDRVRLERALFQGSVIVSGSGFASNFDIVESDVGGDLVLESSEFASNLELGRDTILRGQIVVDGVRVAGDMAIDGIDVIDTYLDPLEIEIFAAAAGDATVAPACICEHRDGSFNIDSGRLDVERPSLGTVEQACKRFPNLPRCPRSNGFNPVLIEISHTDVAGLFNLIDLALGSKGAGFRPFKSSDLRFASLDERETCPYDVGSGELPPAKCESSLSRLENPIILIDDVSVSGAALLRGNQGNSLYLNHSSIERLVSEDNELGSLIVARNEFGALKSLKDTFYRGLSITRNKIGGSLELDSLVLSDEVVRNQKEPQQLWALVNHNFVERDLVFTPSGVTGGTIDEVDLSTNRVGGELAVSLPVAAASAPATLAWSGSIRLKSVAADGTLAVRLAYPSKGDRMIVDTEGDLSDEGVLCDRKGARAAVHLDLANTMAKNLLWAVPLLKPERSAADCVSWEGVGLRYDNWEAGPGWRDLGQDNGTPSSGGGSGQLPKLLDLWRGLYALDGGEANGPSFWMIGDNAVPPDPLHQMADHLAKIGEQKASREVRAEAKGAGFRVPAGSPVATVGNIGATVGNIAAWIVFLPTDFGTKPERAFFVLAGFTLVAWGIYNLCRSRYRRRWWKFERARDALVKRDRIREALLQHLASRNLDRNGDDVGTAEGRLTEVLDHYASMPTESSTGSDAPGLSEGESQHNTPVPGLSEGELRHISAVPGFMQYDRNRQPQHFNLWRYAIDTMIPVIDLHAYNQYYPIQGVVRSFAMLQHVVGWWVLTSFLASLAVF
jgi:hypothetical protein